MTKTKSITEIARQGGKACLKKHGKKYFSQLAKKSWASRKRKKK